MNSRLAAALVFCGGISVGCGASPAAGPYTGPGSGSAAERYFPIVDGNIYTYATKDTALGDGLLTMRAHRIDATHGELIVGGKTKSFVFVGNSVTYDNGAIVLKAPFEKGATWQGEHGCPTSIAETDLKVELIEKALDGCFETREACPEATNYRTLFCPDVGITRLIVEKGRERAVVQLRSYGKPVTL